VRAPKNEDRGKNEARLAARRSQILEAAYRAFASKGYRDTMVADIAQKLGIGHGTFYRYFANAELQSGKQRVKALARLASSELEAMFLTSHIGPADFTAVSGDPEGRVLAVPGIDRGWLGSATRRFQGSKLYPWEGKSFSALTADTGRGINRFRYPLRRGYFPFRTSLADSRVDGQPCIAIDYDVPANPWLARNIYDELRALGDGLYLGRGGMRRAGLKTPALVLWFLVDTRAQSPALR
jgi:AcrR family transcriptional regulator